MEKLPNQKNQNIYISSDDASKFNLKEPYYKDYSSTKRMVKNITKQEEEYTGIIKIDKVEIQVFTDELNTTWNI